MAVLAANRAITGFIANYIYKRKHGAPYDENYTVGHLVLASVFLFLSSTGCDVFWK